MKNTVGRVALPGGGSENVDMDLKKNGNTPPKLRIRYIIENVQELA